MPTFRYTNPITRDRSLSMRDHCVLRVGDAWYCTGTSAPIWSGPNPGVRLLASRDLLNWTHAAWLIDASTLSADCAFNGRFWAPEIHRAQDRFWLTVNCGYVGPTHGDRRMDDHNVWLFASDHIEGPYALVSQRPLGEGFKNDATLFTDADGHTYCYCSGGGLWQAEIDLEAGRLKGSFQKISSPRDAGNPDWMVGGIEGPFVVHRANRYWMLFSAWTRGYEVGILQADHPLGPWTLASPEPIFGTRKRRYRLEVAKREGYDHLIYEDTRDPFVETGHCSLFEGPDGRDWISCHYFLEGQQPLPAPEGLIEYRDTEPQLGIEPIDWSISGPKIVGPTWTEQAVSW